MSFKPLQSNRALTITESVLVRAGTGRCGRLESQHPVVGFSRILPAASKLPVLMAMEASVGIPSGCRQTGVKHTCRTALILTVLQNTVAVSSPPTSSAGIYGPAFGV